MSKLHKLTLTLISTFTALFLTACGDDNKDPSPPPQPAYDAKAWQFGDKEWFIPGDIKRYYRNDIAVSYTNNKMGSRADDTALISSVEQTFLSKISTAENIGLLGIYQHNDIFYSTWKTNETDPLPTNASMLTLLKLDNPNDTYYRLFAAGTGEDQIAIVDSIDGNLVNLNGITAGNTTITIRFSGQTENADKIFIDNGGLAESPQNLYSTVLPNTGTVWFNEDCGTVTTNETAFTATTLGAFSFSESNPLTANTDYTFNVSSPKAEGCYVILKIDNFPETAFKKIQ